MPHSPALADGACRPPWPARPPIQSTRSWAHTIPDRYRWRERFARHAWGYFDRGLCSTGGALEDLLKHPMSANSDNSPDQPENPAAAEAPRVRRISNPRPKKPAKDQAEPAATEGLSVAAPLPAVAVPLVSDSQASRSDWPEPDAASAGATGPPDHAKRKRRRKKGKGHNPQAP